MCLSFQVYRDLKEVTPEAMQMVKRNFEWVSERVKVHQTHFSNLLCVIRPDSMLVFAFNKTIIIHHYLRFSN